MIDMGLFVVVFTPTLGEAGEDLDGSGGLLGTGYPVAPGLILTSGHVVAPENRDERYPIEVARVPLGVQEDFEPDWQEAGFEWVGPDPLDVALIRCPPDLAPDSCSSGILYDTLPRAGLNWSSRGFPKATRRDSVPGPRDFGGPVRGNAEVDSRFSAETSSSTRHKDGWDGTSGMPVVVDGRILGVVAEVLDPGDNQVFLAVPTRRLLRNDDFKRILDWDPRRDYLDQVRTSLHGDLQDHQRAAAALAAEVGVVAGDTKALAKVLLGMSSLEQLFDYARNAQAAIRKRAVDEHSVDDAALADIARLVLSLLPPRADWDAVTRVRRGVTDSGSGLIAVPAAEKTVAEVIMAAVDSRVASFESPESDTDFPRGTSALADPGEGGRDPSGDLYEDDLIRDLVNLLEGDIDGDSKTEQAFEKYMAQRFVAKKTRNVPEFLITRINRQLEIYAKGPNAVTFYVVVRASDDEPSSSDRRRADIIDRLKTRFTSLVFLQLEDPGVRNDQDYNDYAPLARVMLAAKPKQAQD